MAEPPTFRGFQFQLELVASAVDLDARFGELVSVHAEWPADHYPREFLELRPAPDGGLKFS
jgi:hypothetical protein